MLNAIGNKKYWVIFAIISFVSGFANAVPSIDTNVCVEKWTKLAKLRDSKYKLTKQDFTLWQETLNTLSKVQSFGQLLQQGEIANVF